MTLRLAVAAALAEAEAAGLREVADVILTLARQLEEERQRADRLEDEAAKLRAPRIEVVLRHPWRRRPWEEPDAPPVNPTAIERPDGAASGGGHGLPAPAMTGAVSLREES